MLLSDAQHAAPRADGSVPATGVLAPLLMTKLYAPRPQPDVVHRPRLDARLACGLAGALTLISAPAGFGKTTLAAQWARQTNLEMAWLSLDTGDNDPVIFLSYLVAAIQSVAPNVGSSALLLLQSPQPPALTTLLTLVLNDLATLDRELLLVLDDYHLLRSAAVHEAVAFLLQHLPLQLRLLIITREDPPLPLTRLRALRRLVELRASDLRFTTDEAATLLRGRMGLAVTDADVMALEAYTEGWVAGLHLAALAMQERGDVQAFVQAFAGSHGFIVEYLVEEVFERLPAHLHRFLLHTSILERFCAPLCDAVILGDATDPRDSYSRLLIEQLERMNLFVTPLDDERRWFRFHHLFAEVLHARLLMGATGEFVAALHHRASLWFERHGLDTEAIHHALIASDFPHAAGLIERNADAILKRGEYMTLHAWLARLPDQVVHARPRLSLFRAWTCTFTNDLEAAERCLQDAERAVRLSASTEDGPAILGEVAVIRSGIAINRSAFPGLPRIRELVDQALAGLPITNTRLRGMAMLHLGIASYWGGNLPNASRALAEAGLLGEAANDSYTLLLALHNQAVVCVAQGKLRQAATGFRHVLHAAVQRGVEQMPTTGYAHLGLAKLLYDWNDLAVATFHLGEAIELGTRGRNPRLLAMSYTALARVLQAQADAVDALSTFRQAEQLAQKYELPPYCTVHMAACQVQLHLMQGNLAAASDWIAARRSRDDDALDFLQEVEHLALARVLIAQGEFEEVLRLLDQLQQAAGAAGRVGSVIEILALEALAFHAHGDFPAALTALERALDLAAPEGYLRTFVDEGPPMAALLREAHARGIHASYCERLLATFPDRRLPIADSGIKAPPTENPKPKIANLPEPLNERELEVLRLIAAGRSNREIANRLVVALSTVKWHINNLYGKLGVSTRTQALARARELGLI